jgi:hypothetical protein
VPHFEGVAHQRGLQKTLRPYSVLLSSILSRINLCRVKEDNINAVRNPLRRPAAVVTAKRIVDNPWTSEIWVPVAVIERDGVARDQAPILLEHNAGWRAVAASRI